MITQFYMFWFLLAFAIYTILYYTISLIIDKKCFILLFKKYNYENVVDLPYICKQSNLLILQLVTQLVIAVIFFIIIPMILLTTIMSKMDWGITFDLQISHYLSFFVVLLFLFSVIIVSYTVKKNKPMIEITKEYIKFSNWPDKSNLFSKPIYFSEIKSAKKSKSNISILSDDWSIDIPLKKILTFKGYNEVLGRLER